MGEIVVMSATQDGIDKEQSDESDKEGSGEEGGYKADHNDEAPTDEEVEEELDEGEAAEQPPPSDCMSFNKLTHPASIPVSMLDDFVALAQSGDDAKQLYGTMMVRKLLSVDSNVPANEVVETGVCPLLATFLTRSDFPELQFEAAWALTNISAVTNTIDLNTIPHFIALLSSPSDDCREQATWAIGNMAGESPKYRDHLLELGALEPLLRMINAPCDRLPFLRNTVWALCNFCRGKPPPPAAELEKVVAALPALIGLLSHQDDEVATDTCWAISYITDCPNDRIQRVLDAGVLESVVKLLNSSNERVFPAIRIVGNLVQGDDKQTQAVINAGALTAVYTLLSHPKRSIRKEACWTLSNIAAGTAEQVQAIVNANLFPPLIRTMVAAELEVKKEAMWAVANAVDGGTDDHVRYLVEIGALQALVESLPTISDAKDMAHVLKATASILLVGEKEKTPNLVGYNRFFAMLCNLGGLDKIEALRERQEPEVLAAVNEIFNTYCAAVECH